MLPGTLFGKAQRLTATGASVISSANAHIIGVLFQGTGTGSLQIFAGLTATAATGTGGGAVLGTIIAYATATGATANSSIYYPFPAACSGGITVNVPGTADPNITLFWNPSGGA